MPGMGERAYVYAKVCGIIGKSYTGPGISKLNTVSRLSDLDRLIFSTNAKDLPERELLSDLEWRIIHRAVDQIVKVISSFSEPPELLIRLVQSYELADLKTVLSALVAKEPKLPNVSDLGPFRTIKFDAYPDLDLMLKDTEYSWLLDRKDEISDSSRLVLLHIEMDHQYYVKLWESLFKLRKDDCISIKKIIGEEISIRNVVWTLRLRTYYNTAPEEITKRLVDIPTGRGKQTLAQDALDSMNFALDSYGDWIKWKRHSFVNPEKPGESWRLDPRYFQNLSAEYLHKLARSLFRRRPFAIDTAACFIKLKQYEEDLLTSVAEGLSLGMTAQDVLTMLEVKQ